MTFIVNSDVCKTIWFWRRVGFLRKLNSRERFFLCVWWRRLKKVPDDCRSYDVRRPKKMKLWRNFRALSKWTVFIRIRQSTTLKRLKRLTEDKKISKKRSYVHSTANKNSSSKKITVGTSHISIISSRVADLHKENFNGRLDDGKQKRLKKNLIHSTFMELSVKVSSFLLVYRGRIIQDI